MPIFLLSNFLSWTIIFYLTIHSWSPFPCLTYSVFNSYAAFDTFAVFALNNIWPLRYLPLPVLWYKKTPLSLPRDEGVIRGTTLINAEKRSLCRVLSNTLPLYREDTPAFARIHKPGFSSQCSKAAFILLLCRIAPTSGSLRKSQDYSSSSSLEYGFL